MLQHEDFLRQWENIVADVNKTNVPLECVKKVVLRLPDNKKKTINVHTLTKQGLSMDEVESLLSRTLHTMDAVIQDVEFVVDVRSVAELVQPETDKILGNLK